MIVVADTSPLNYLIQIECDFLLPVLYRQVIVPPAVVLELRHPSAPSSIQRWLTTLPPWIEIGTITQPLDIALATLDLGEREAIQLAEESKADLVLIDERRGRLAARHRGLVTCGTLGVLAAAGQSGLVDPESALEKLISEKTFRCSIQLRETYLAAVRKGNETKPMV